jgi:hypothetical protein
MIAIREKAAVRAGGLRVFVAANSSFARREGVTIVGERRFVNRQTVDR